MMIAAAPRSGAGEARPIGPLSRTPRRLTRSRKKGARTAPGAVYCGRPTIRNNPFSWRRFGFARAYRLFCRWIEFRLGDLTLEGLGFSPGEIDALHRRRCRLIAHLAWLRGRDLECWCPRNCSWCHADVLLALANRQSVTLQ